MSTWSFMDTHATLASDDGTIDLGYGAAVAEEGITVAMLDNKNTMTIGADGEGMHALHASKAGTVTVRLLKTSPTNAKLMNLYNVQQQSAKKWGKNSFTLNNPSAGDNVSATKLAFQKAPDYNAAKEGQTVEWVFDAIKIDMKLGSYE
ncbi:phage structural protein [Acinetobacter sp. HY1485]|uniref:phage structural protein n=1 Tax=Acinetobacter sp. HY1485 TaxID=2970918 RepID=UPI0022B950A1|nr:phage protein [Acinetobacter sp. HY1485]